MGYDVDKALSYIMENGSVMDTYKLEFLLDLGRDDKIPLDFFNRFQNPDGGFCYDLRAGGPSSLGTTLDVLPWYLLLDVTYSGSYKRCINFILDGQSSEGFWDENQKIRDHDPPEILTPGVLSTKLFLTPRTSIDLKYYDINEYAAKKAMLYMEGFLRADGSFEGHPMTNWYMFSLYSQLNEPDKADNIVPFISDSKEKDPKFIVWQLDCIWKANRENHLAEDLLDRLEGLQAENGCWRTDGGKKYYPLVTAEAIRALKVWGRE